MYLDILIKFLIVYYKPKYRYNSYLQNLDLITFVRNPYHRFISTFIDKHVLKTDHIYLQLQGYREFINNYSKNNIYNLAHFVTNKKYISDHYSIISENQTYHFLMNKYKTIKIIRIEDGVSKHLFDFFIKYHKNINVEMLDIFDNKISDKLMTLSEFNPSSLPHKSAFISITCAI